jgi:excisionase family DNA binding protein
MFSPEQAGELLGVSAETVRRMMDRGELPHRLIGNRRRISRGQLEAWQAKGERPTGRSR